MSKLERAIEIAVEAHAGQVDRNGAPYILHPLRVMAQMESNEERIVAVLHDVVEDNPAWSFARLREEGFGEAVMVALEHVTKREGEAYADFVGRSAQRPLARRVKLADLRDNMDIRRLDELDDRAVERLRRYLAAWHFLTREGSGYAEKTETTDTANP